MADLGAGFDVTVDAPAGPVFTLDPPASPSVVVVPVAGPQGAAGESGAGPEAYTHTQTLASSVWTVQHNLGFNARPTVLNVAGDVVLGWTPTWPTVNVLILTFPSAQSGTCYVS